MRIDLHAHSIYSRHWFWGFDSISTPKEMIEAAIKRGLNGLAITDHNTVKGSLVAKRIAKKYKDFIIITGSEIKTKDGEVTALGIKENIPLGLSLEETIEKIHDLGGIAIAPHPFGKYFFRKCVGEKAVNADAIEVFNSTLTNNANKRALILAEKFKKPKTAGSDAHSIREVGNAGIICNSNPIEDILNGKIKIFGKYTSLIDIAYLTARKFIRSAEWRISRSRGKYF